MPENGKKRLWTIIAAIATAVMAVPVLGMGLHTIVDSAFATNQQVQKVEKKVAKKEDQIYDKIEKDTVNRRQWKQLQTAIDRILMRVQSISEFQKKNLQQIPEKKQ